MNISPLGGVAHVCRSLSRDYSEAVFIGGVAMAVHEGTLGEVSDLDLYVSRSGLFVLRDQFEIRYSAPCGKHWGCVGGFDLDIYVEGEGFLYLPFGGVLGDSIMIDEIRVASLEHLLVLKTAAASARAQWPKGAKDLADIGRISALLRRGP